MFIYYFTGCATKPSGMQWQSSHDRSEHSIECKPHSIIHLSVQQLHLFGVISLFLHTISFDMTTSDDRKHVFRCTDCTRRVFSAMPKHATDDSLPHCTLLLPVGSPHFHMLLHHDAVLCYGAKPP